MNEWMTEWMTEWLNEWMNEWMNAVSGWNSSQPLRSEKFIDSTLL